MQESQMNPLSDLNLNTPLKLTKAKSIGDRFIPKAVCANLYDLYFCENGQTPKNFSKYSGESNSGGKKSREKDSAYVSLLKSHLLHPSHVPGLNTATLLDHENHSMEAANLRLTMSADSSRTRAPLKTLNFTPGGRTMTPDSALINNLHKLSSMGDGMGSYKKSRVKYRRKISKHP